MDKSSVVYAVILVIAFILLSTYLTHLYNSNRVAFSQKILLKESLTASNHTIANITSGVPSRLPSRLPTNATPIVPRNSTLLYQAPVVNHHQRNVIPPIPLLNENNRMCGINSLIQIFYHSTFIHSSIYMNLQVLNQSEVLSQTYNCMELIYNSQRFRSTTPLNLFPFFESFLSQIPAGHFDVLEWFHNSVVSLRSLTFFYSIMNLRTFEETEMGFRHFWPLNEFPMVNHSLGESWQAYLQEFIIVENDNDIRQRRIHSLPQTLHLSMISKERLLEFSPLPDHFELQTSPQTEPKRYRLSAVMVYRASSSSSGHYTAFVRTDQTWFHCDDTRITTVNEIRLNVNEIVPLIFYQLV